MREDRSTPPYLNRALLLVVPATLVSLVILASFWAATFQPPNPDKQFEGDKEDKGDKVKSVDKDQLKVEIIIPHKSWPPPLKEHDLLYDSPAPESLVRHHSGHYRRKLADIWDPHPQYEFKAFGKTFQLQLQLGPSFTTPDLQVTQVWRNMSIKESPRVKPNGCFYSGKVLGDSASSVAVNLCHGIIFQLISLI